METEFIPIDFDYLDIDNQTYIKIFGRNKQGKRLCILDKFNDYFYLITKNPKKIPFPIFACLNSTGSG